MAQRAKFVVVFFIKAKTLKLVRSGLVAYYKPSPLIFLPLDST